MALGSPKTNKYKIGTAEVRVGILTNANKLTPSFSVGLLDNVTVEVAQTSVDLKGGFPKFLADTAITDQEVTVTATLREYSRRNLRLMLGEGVSGAEPVDDQSLIVTDVSAGGTAVDVTASDGTKFAADDIVIIFTQGAPENVSICRVASVATDTVTLDSDTPLLHDVNGTTTTVNIVLGFPVAVGGVTQTNYFSMDVIEAERSTGRPIMWKFWKAALSGGLNAASNSDDFASAEFQAKILAPAASEYGAGGDLLHLADIIPNNPMGMYIGGGD